MTQHLFATKTPSGHYSTFGESEADATNAACLKVHQHRLYWANWESLLAEGWTVGPVTVTDGHTQGRIFE